MANRPQQLVQLPLHSYSRTEFTAPRARVKGLPLETIERMYFDRDGDDPVDVAQLLRTMCDELVAAALRDGSPVLKSHPLGEIEKCGESRLAPPVIPPTPGAREKFGEPVDTDEEVAGAAMEGGYSVRGARGLTQLAIAQLLEVMRVLTEPERRKPASTSPHAFRHTVGTQMLATGVALEVVLRTFGHASLGTTSIYVSPEEARMRREAAKYHARLACDKGER